MPGAESPGVDPVEPPKKDRRTRSELLDDEPDLFGLRQHFAEIESARNSTSVLDGIRRMREVLAEAEEYAVIAERQRQTSWDRIAEALGVTKTTVINRHKDKVEAWAPDPNEGSGFATAYLKVEESWTELGEIVERRAAARDMQVAADAMREPIAVSPVLRIDVSKPAFDMEAATDLHQGPPIEGARTVTKWPLPIAAHRYLSEHDAKWAPGCRCKNHAAPDPSLYRLLSRAVHSSDPGVAQATVVRVRQLLEAGVLVQMPPWGERPAEEPQDDADPTLRTDADWRAQIELRLDRLERQHGTAS